MFIDALAYVTERQPEKFAEVLRKLLERYPDTDITPIAASWLKGIQQGRKLHSPENGNIRGMIWDLKLSDNDSIVSDAPLEFDLSPDNSQLLVMVFDAAEVQSHELLYEIARHNFTSFVVKDFDLEPMNFGRLGMIVIRGFNNLNELNHYRRVMADSHDFKLPPGVRPVAISSANFEKMINEGRTFDDYFRYLEQQNYIDAQADILQPQEIETLEEADEAQAALADETSADQDNNALQDAADKPSRDKPVQDKPGTQTPDKKKTPAKDKKDKAAKNKPAQPATPPAVLPAYEPGSEGDDPLLDE